MSNNAQINKSGERNVFMTYKELSSEQRTLRQKVWEDLLKDFCPPINGCQPCDLGCVCDNCCYDYNFLKDNAHETLRRGGVLIDEDLKYFSSKGTLTVLDVVNTIRQHSDTIALYRKLSKNFEEMRLSDTRGMKKFIESIESRTLNSVEDIFKMFEGRC